MPLEKRKALCSLLLYFSVYKSYEDEIKEDVSEYAFKSIRDDIYYCLISEFDEPNYSQPIDSFLSDLIDTVENLVSQKFPKVVNSDLFKRFFKDLRSNSSLYHCNSCEKKCSGDIFRDSKIVANSGECITNIKSAFNQAYSIADKYYTEYSTINTQKPDVILSTITDSQKPIDSHPDISVTGTTRFLKYQEKSTSRIRYVVFLNGFNWRSHLATTYIFFHECFCHAFQNLYPNQNDRKTPDPHDLFSEGWMDYIAFSVMKRELGANNFGSYALPVDPILLIGENVHHYRVGYGLGEKSIFYKSRRAGYEAAIRLYLFLHYFDMTQDEIDRLFYQLSFDLNIYSFPFSEIEEFVIKLLAFLPRIRTGRKFQQALANSAKFTRTNPLTPLISQYSQDNDLKSLLEQVVAL
jgi:hypothetical protein